MTDMKHLRVRKGEGRSIYEVQKRVPPSLEHILGSKLVKSTGTSDLREARRRRSRILAEFEERIESARQTAEAPKSRPRWLIGVARELARKAEDGQLSAEGAADQLYIAFERLVSEAQYKLDDHGRPEVPAKDEKEIKAAFETLRETRGEPTLRAAIKEHLKNLDGSIRNQTLELKRVRLEGFAEWFGDAPVSKVTKADAARYFTDVVRNLKGKTGGPLAPKTMSSHLADIRVFFDHCAELQYRDDNPFLGIGKKTIRDKRRDPAEERRRWEGPELVSFFADQRPENWQWVLAALAMYTGARMAELTSVTVDMVHDSYIDVPGTKSESASRSVPLHPVIRPLVSKLKAESTDGYLISGIEFSKSQDDKRVYRLSDVFSKTKTKLGFPSSVTFHSFRHSLTNELERAGVPESTIALIDGHSRKGVTLGTYSRAGLPVESLLREIEKLDYGPELTAVIERGIERTVQPPEGIPKRRRGS